MQSLSVFLDKGKFADFWRKNADVNRNQRVCHVIQIFLDLLWVRYNWTKFHHCRTCVTDFREEGTFLHPSSASSPKKTHPE